MIFWISIAEFVVLVGLVLIRAVMLRKQGVKVILFGATDKSDFLLMPIVIFFIYTLVGLPLPYVLNHLVFNSAILKWCGAILCAAALVWFAAALNAFGKSFRVGIDEKTTDKLITTGLFAVSRNPLYVGFHIFFIGRLLIAPNLASLIILVFFAAVIHRQIIREEQFLKGHYGQEYEEYCGRIRRYL